MHSINPIKATDSIRATYSRYLRTTYGFSDSTLRSEFEQAVATEDLLVKGPFVEASPPFQPGSSIGDLVQEGVLNTAFHILCGPDLPIDRKLHLHQEQAVRKVVAGGRNVVVATGTGSGKTETFLLSIFDHLLREREAGTLSRPGVRALLLYPMNALANDQLKRLRNLLRVFPEITFGRYTGETQPQFKDALDLHKRLHRADPPRNEYISRDQMQKTPPHLLITNYAMLEYLLLRPNDTTLFDGETGEHWKFIVLDEAHTYDGATGIEIAMLLRRLKDRVVRSEAGKLTCIATSATLGSGPKDFPEVVSFASQLFGERFEWEDNDSARQDVVQATRERQAALKDIWGAPDPSFYSALAAALDNGAPTTELGEIARKHGVAASVIQSALAAYAREPEPDSGTERFLHALLSGDSRVHQLRGALASPKPLNNLGLETSLGFTPELVVNIAGLAVRARESQDAVALLPARYHLFARALEGAFLCLNREHPAHTSDTNPRLRLARHEKCPHCEGVMVEIASCSRCGTAYVVGEEKPDERDASLIRLKQSGVNTDDPTARSAFFILDDSLAGDTQDEDDVALENDEGDDKEVLQPWNICLGCAALWAEGAPRPRCGCNDSAPISRLRRVQVVQTKKSKAKSSGLGHCVSCGGRSPGGTVYRFLTGQDAPVAVLATALYQLLPVDGKLESSPGGGRKLLAFADSRQDAAFFAPYLDSTYHRLLRRHLIYQSLCADEAGRNGELRLRSVATNLRTTATQANLFAADEDAQGRLRLAQTWLMQELISIDSRNGLEGIGMLRFSLRAPSRWAAPPPLLQAPWNLSEQQVLELYTQLLSTVRLQGAVDFPEGVSVESEHFEPRARAIYIRQYSDSKQGILGWSPTAQSNKRLDYLQRLLQKRGLSGPDSMVEAKRTLEKIWQDLTFPSSAWGDYLKEKVVSPYGVVYQLNHQIWDWTPTLEGNGTVFECNRCRVHSSISIEGVCPTLGCTGSLVPIDTTDPKWQDNHYRALYTSLDPIEIRTQEHTAQWDSIKAGEIQQEFVKGDINVLSCSTTFELGVDVGELQAVFMRNVPPTTANYLQRAGRAGRRTDSAALVLTYAQRRSHDLNYYRDPVHMIAGNILPPVINLANEKIARRHVHSVLLAAFFRWANDLHGLDYKSVGTFFLAPEGTPTAPELLRAFVDSRPQAVADALLRIVPEALRPVFGIEKWAWYEELQSTAGNGILDKATLEVEDDIRTYHELELTASGLGEHRRAGYYQRVSQTIKIRPLYGFLGRRNVLPSYGFPSDVVELKTSHVQEDSAKSLELDRDLRTAIVEYAPGAQVVAGKKLWTSAGVIYLPNRALELMHYAICSKCKRFNFDKQNAPETCSGCGEPFRDRQKYIRPEFGFIASHEVREPRDRRPLRMYAAQSFFTEYRVPNGAPIPDFTYHGELCHPGLEVRSRYSRYGVLTRVNSGNQKAGFRICNSCGWGEPVIPLAPGEKPGKSSGHKNPRTQKPCGGKFEHRHLGHECLTDVLELQFYGAQTAFGQETLWLSVLYALLEAAANIAGIPRDDLDGTTYYHDYAGGFPPALVFFDNVPGGAGHVKRLQDLLPAITRHALARVEACSCGAETSCYECLRSYQNQWCHEKLVRGAARDFLRLLLPEAEQGETQNG